ncbi:MAG: class II aldolase/adducin family protein [Acidobacteriota bacterium]|nr:MAG: class II aldolase/adducin family protein [Acidobacteriota bacterium]
MKLAFVTDRGAVALESLRSELTAIFARDQHEILDQPDEQVDLVLNLTGFDEPRANYMRPHASVFVATIVRTETGDAWSDSSELQKAIYRVLVKTMSNVVVHLVHGGRHGQRAYFVTPELGFRAVPADETLSRAIADYVTPLAGAHMVINNRLDEDLPRALWDGDERSRELAAFGRKLAEMKLLPNVFDITEILDQRDLRMMMKVFGIKQLSYGNLSARCDAHSFWMTGRGVQKADLRVIGRDILLVKGYDAATHTILLSVPEGVDATSRVSVDAIEHFKIYGALPEVGAIVHVHAWMDGIEATQQSWPCGTEQLADEVLELVLRAPDPARAVVGLKNHGLTITGHSLGEIFERIEGKLVQAVPALD